MPSLRSQQRLRISEQLRILRDPVFVANVALSVLVFTAMFTAHIPTSPTRWKMPHSCQKLKSAGG
jgi:hypothetical protein